MRPNRPDPAAELASLREVAQLYLKHADALPLEQRRELAPAWEILAGAICKLENGYFPPTERERELARLRASSPPRPPYVPRCIRCGAPGHEHRCPRCLATDLETAAILAALIAKCTSKPPEVRAAAAAYAARSGVRQV